MNIGVVSSIQYLNYINILCKSIIFNNNQDLNVYILSNELANDDLTLLDSFDGKVIYHLINIKNELFDSIDEKRRYGIYTYFRLLAYELLPKELNRILWLDLDIVINGSIENFYFQDFDNNSIIACKDSAGEIRNVISNDLINKYSLDGNSDMFNAGVMLMNLDKVRKINPIKKIKKIILEDQLKLTFADQDVFNIVFHKDVKFDSSIYNYMTMKNGGYSFIQNPIIIHYAGSIKPDNYKYHDSHLKEYWKYYKEYSTTSYVKFKILNTLYRFYHYMRSTNEK